MLDKLLTLFNPRGFLTLALTFPNPNPNGRGFLREVLKAGRPAGLRPGPVVSLVCDALCFPDSPWLGCARSIVGVGGEVITANGYSSRDSSWKDHREVFRAILVSFLSTTT